MTDKKPYSPADAREISSRLDRVSVIDMTAATAEFKLGALQKLVDALDVALKIAIERHYEGKSEPYPGACRMVMEQSRNAVDVARKTGLMPERGR